MSCILKGDSYKNLQHRVSSFIAVLISFDIVLVVSRLAVFCMEDVSAQAFMPSVIVCDGSRRSRSSKPCHLSLTPPSSKVLPDQSVR